MKHLLLTFLLSVFCYSSGFAQIGNNKCEGALPFCTGTPYSFPAGTGSASAQVGPYYSCLSSTPNPAWYYMKIATPGMIQITMHSEPSHDIDFCLWGPFDTQNACGQLTSGKVIDCSYSTAATEIVDIPNAVLGKYYILVITNYSNLPCNIIFSQTGGPGVTDCTILPPAATSNGPICVGETLHLNAANMNNAVYHWFGPDGWTSIVQNPLRPNATLSMAGIYSLFVTINGVPSADTNHTTVAVFDKPTAIITGDAVLCEGDSTAITISCENHPPWNVTYTTNGLEPKSVPVNISPYTFYVSAAGTNTYALTQVSNIICNGTTSGSAVVTVNPNPVPDFLYNNTCSLYPTQFSDNSSVSGGFISSWLWNFGVSADSSNLQSPSYIFANGGTYNVLLRVASNNGCISELTKLVVIQQTPLVQAGADKTIPYGTSTSLLGEASGGSGNYSYQWEPADKLNNPNIQNPQTVNLSTTTDYNLSVTDAGNSCQQSDGVTVTVAGGPLGIQVVADPPALCGGTNSFINLQAGGGSGNYTYTWSSDPAGFSSNLEDITVQPVVTTHYTVVANDGFNAVTKTVTVTVYEDPTADAGSDQSISFGTSTTLTGSAGAGITPYTYSWSPANLVITPLQKVTPTAILSGTTNFTLSVTDGHGCSALNQILVTVTGGALKVRPEAVKPTICVGENTMLLPLSEGGSGNYTYNWTSESGFSSHEISPVVSPRQTTTYHLSIYDGFTTNTGEVTVKVNPLPVINLIPPGAHVVGNDTIMACVFDTVTISAAGADLIYLWSNGATTPAIESTTTGIAFDMLTYSIEVTNTLTLCSNSAILTVIYGFDECSYGVDEQNTNLPVLVYPNPGKGIYTCKLKLDYSDVVMEISNSQGAVIQKKSVSLYPGSVQNIPIDLISEPAGIYFLKIYNNSFIRIVKIIRY
jgi:PKD repeat protein